MSIKKYLPTITIFIIIVGIIALGIYFSERDSTINKELAKLDLYSKEELSFLEEQGFLNNIDSENLPSNKEQIISLLKSSNLIEQNLNSPDESFEVLATKLDENTYQLAFKLENKSNQSKEFYLIPISESSQTEFKEIKGIVKGGKVSWGNQGDWGYDIEKHKQELRPELAKAYDDIDNNGYTGKPIKLVLEANSTLLAQSKWEINGDRISDSLKPVYLLVYGSAGGAKDEPDIIGAEFLIYNKDHWMDALTQEQIDEYIKKHPNFMDKYNSRNQRGDVIEVRPAGYWTGPKAPGYDKSVFLLVIIPGLSFEEAKHYGESLIVEDKLIKKRKYNFSNVVDKQVINNISEITEKGL